jgi:tagatose-6-phosphate ketose/aldose isomerase
MVPQSTSESNTAPPSTGFTYGEILQQPALWPTTLELVRASDWKDDKPSPAVIITGAGTSAYAAAAIARSWPNAHAVPTTDLLIETPDQLQRAFPDFANSGLLVSIGRSGDSPESVAVVERIKRLFPDVAHVAITCNREGQLARTKGVHPIILDPRTNDRGLAMTSSFSNLVLAGICLHRSNEVTSILDRVCRDVRNRFSELDDLAKSLTAEPIERVVVLASGSLRPLASEACLKILEMTAGRIATLPETFLGLRHGPMSFVTPGTIVVCCLSSSQGVRRYEEDLVRELRQKRLGQTVGIAPEGTDRGLFDAWIPANAGTVADELRIPFEIPFAQLLAYHLSVRQGLDPDNPSPMGAITRVVQKFVIYGESADV